MKNSLKSIYITRPIVFLCGCGIDENNLDSSDRRLILKNYILEKNRNENYRFMPIIVDRLFKHIPQNKKISLQLLEEIMSSVSERIYIFLDTMSTSYELGQFSNFKMSTKITCFLENSFKQRANCEIGSYIKKTQWSNFVKYLCDEIRRRENNFLYFRNDKMPKKMKKVVDCHFREYDLNKNAINLNFVLDEELFRENNIYVNKQNDHLTFNLSIKTFFYLLSTAVDMTENKVTGMSFDDEKYHCVVEKVKYTLLDSFLYNHLTLSNIKKYPDIEIKIDGYFNQDQIKYNIFALIVLIAQAKKEKNDIYSIMDADYKSYSYHWSFNVDIMTKLLWNLTDKEYKLLEIYNNCPDDFIEKKNLIIKGKARKITAYKSTYFGRYLKSIHKKMNNEIKSFLPTSPNSYAYKENYSTRICIERHLESSNFIKLDIHDYFDSIKISILREKINKYVQSSKIYKHLSEYPLSKKIRYCFSPSSFRVIFGSMFYNHHLPIGFVTSPLLSDFYLNLLDEKVTNEANINGVIYTRYADDILLSGTNFSSLEKIEKLINEEIPKNKLALNNSKRIQKKLKQYGDSIRFLGINIVKDKTQNRLSISKKYLIKLSKDIADYYKNPYDENRRDALNSTISYIKNISVNSYRLLSVIFNNHVTDNRFSFPITSYHKKY